MANKKITFSIVICTYNGAKKIEPAIKSILSQNYPKGQYEVIVVDDGSTDNTVNVVSKYPVELIRNKKNLGIAASRNIGLAHSRGVILVCFDDDCVANTDWLINLSKAYIDPKVMGVGSFLMKPSSPNITDSYLYYYGYGNPAPLTVGKHTTILGRFWGYLVSNFSITGNTPIDGTLVAELPGAVASYRVSMIHSVGGWDDTLSDVAEDSQLSRKLRNNNKDSYFVSMGSASLTHNHQMHLFNFLTKEYLRGKKRKAYYKMNKLIPPYFPSPIIFVILLFVALLHTHLVVYLVFLPILLYPWWIYRSIYLNDVRLILFPYIQLFHESVIVLGMI